MLMVASRPLFLAHANGYLNEVFAFSSAAIGNYRLLVRRKLRLDIHCIIKVFLLVGPRIFNMDDDGWTCAALRENVKR